MTSEGRSPHYPTRLDWLVVGLAVFTSTTYYVGGWLARQGVIGELGMLFVSGTTLVMGSLIAIYALTMIAESLRGIPA